VREEGRCRVITVVIQARVSSTRLPAKVLQPILGQPMLGRMLERVKRVELADRIVVATSVGTDDDRIEAVAADFGVGCFRGSLDDVLDRFYEAVRHDPPDHIVRLTGDCPLIDPTIVDDLVRMHLAGGYDYTTNALEPTFPDGMDTEAMRFSVLETAWREARLSSEREHVTPFVYNHPERFCIGQYKGANDLSGMRLTVDHPEDLALVKAIYEGLYPGNPSFSLEDVLNYLHQNPDLLGLNAGIVRNEGYEKSLAEDRERAKERCEDV
jgi:spore coat polysaccharide biosynthesis protein SpsF